MNKEKVSMNVARLKKSGAVFEVVIEPEKALAYKKGQAELREALRDEQVYSDAKKGLVASSNEIHKVLGWVIGLSLKARYTLKFLNSLGELSLSIEFVGLFIDANPIEIIGDMQFIPHG